MTMNSVKTCFVLEPDYAHDREKRRLHDLVYKHIIKPSLLTLDFRVYRSSSLPRPRHVSHEHNDYVDKAHLLIADISGHDPLVFYYLGRRIAASEQAEQTTLLVTREDEYESLAETPFETPPLLPVRYSLKSRSQQLAHSATTSQEPENAEAPVGSALSEKDFAEVLDERFAEAREELSQKVLTTVRRYLTSPRDGPTLKINNKEVTLEEMQRFVCGGDWTDRARARAADTEQEQPTGASAGRGGGRAQQSRQRDGMDPTEDIIESFLKDLKDW